MMSYMVPRDEVSHFIEATKLTFQKLTCDTFKHSLGNHQGTETSEQGYSRKNGVGVYIVDGSQVIQRWHVIFDENAFTCLRSSLQPSRYQNRGPWKALLKTI